MKLVCILFSISIIVNICAWCAFIIASDYSIIDDSYLSNLNYLNLIFIAFPASIVELIPLVLCVLMLIYNKIKHNAKVLLKVCAYVMAALNLWILVQRLLNQNDDTNKLTTSGYFLFVLPQIISIVGLLLWVLVISVLIYHALELSLQLFCELSRLPYLRCQRLLTLIKPMVSYVSLISLSDIIILEDVFIQLSLLLRLQFYYSAFYERKVER